MKTQTGYNIDIAKKLETEMNENNLEIANIAFNAVSTVKEFLDEKYLGDTPELSLYKACCTYIEAHKHWKKQQLKKGE